MLPRQAAKGQVDPESRPHVFTRGRVDVSAFKQLISSGGGAIWTNEVFFARLKASLEMGKRCYPVRLSRCLYNSSTVMGGGCHDCVPDSVGEKESD